VCEKHLNSECHSWLKIVRLVRLVLDWCVWSVPAASLPNDEWLVCFFTSTRVATFSWALIELPRPMLLQAPCLPARLPVTHPPSLATLLHFFYCFDPNEPLLCCGRMGKTSEGVRSLEGRRARHSFCFVTVLLPLNDGNGRPVNDILDCYSSSASSSTKNEARMGRRDSKCQLMKKWELMCWMKKIRLPVFVCRAAWWRWGWWLHR